MFYSYNKYTYMEDILKKIYDQHDVVCNQKYNGNLPYSFHLKAVVAQVDKYFNLCFNIKSIPDRGITYSRVILGGAGHDLIEDARMTPNDVTTLVKDIEITKIIYCCSEEKGWTRGERHCQKFFDELKKNRLAVYVKLCDIMANALYSRLTNSSMFSKYAREFSNLKDQLYIYGEYNVLWEDLEDLLW